MPTGEQLIQDLLHPHIEARASLGLTPLYWAKQLKAESKAKITKTIKVKGAVGKLPRGYRHVLTTGIIEQIADGERDFTDGESVIMWEERDWGTRQRARMDAMKLDNAYPAKQVELGGKGGNPIPVTWFPPAAANLDEWQRQVEAAEKARMSRETADEAEASPSEEEPTP